MTPARSTRGGFAPSSSPDFSAFSASPRTRRPIVVLKVGGSLITDRRRYRVARLRAIDRVVRAIGAWRAHARPNVVIVLGGGSFGHNVVHRHGIDFGGAHRSPCEVFELSAALFELKMSFA